MAVLSAPGWVKMRWCAVQVRAHMPSDDDAVDAPPPEPFEWTPPAPSAR